MNPKIKIYLGLIVTSIIPLIVFFFLLLYTYNIIISLIVSLVSIILAFFLGLKLISNPILDAFLGKGLLVMSIDSTGIIRLYKSIVIPPKVLIKKGKENEEHFFNRDTMSYLVSEGEANVLEDENSIVIRIPKNRFLYYQFGLPTGIPVLIYNENLKTLVTKDYLAKKEKDLLSHISLEILYKTSELEQKIRDFGRYVVEQLKPRFSFLTNPLFIIAIVILIILIIGFIVSGFGNVVTHGSKALISPK